MRRTIGLAGTDTVSSSDRIGQVAKKRTKAAARRHTPATGAGTRTVACASAPACRELPRAPPTKAREVRYCFDYDTWSNDSAYISALFGGR